jgi:hypothetical protein
MDSALGVVPASGRGHVELKSPVRLAKNHLNHENTHEINPQ